MSGMCLLIVSGRTPNKTAIVTCGRARRWCRTVVLATSLYDDPAAELHEDASARLREHLASPAARSCAGPRRASGVSGYQDPAGGHDEGAVANHRKATGSRDDADSG